MSLFTEAGLRTLSTQYRSARVFKSADTILREAATTSDKSFDVFLSHSIRDAEVVLGVVAALTQQGLNVYVDWIVDPLMDRSRVTPETAERLRQRMRQSSSLIYAHSNQSGTSKWMPWELGYFDGFRQPSPSCRSRTPPKRATPVKSIWDSTHTSTVLVRISG